MPPQSTPEFRRDGARTASETVSLSALHPLGPSTTGVALPSPVRQWPCPLPSLPPTADQYTMQGDAFSKAILENGEVPVPLEDAIENMKVIEALFRSAEAGGWVEVS